MIYFHLLYWIFSSSTLALASTGAAFCSKNSATSKCPERDAMCRGVSTFCSHKGETIRFQKNDLRQAN